jgi:hypothetical protein
VSFERPEDAGEVLSLVRQQLGERRLARLDRLGEDHLAHRVDTIALEEHVLGATEPDADGAEGDRIPCLLRGVGVRAHAHARRLIAPLHELLVVLELLGALRRVIVVNESGDDF